MKKLWFIAAGTGCTCCNYEDHIRGAYRTEEDAKRRVKFYKTGDYYPLASQYARRGVYSVFFEDAEEISGDRLIIGDKVYKKSEVKIIEVGEDGSIENNESEWFAGE